MKKIIGTLFYISFALCGCGIESVFGTSEQRVTWVAIFTVMLVCGLWLRKR